MCKVPRRAPKLDHHNDGTINDWIGAAKDADCVGCHSTEVWHSELRSSDQAQESEEHNEGETSRLHEDVTSWPATHRRKLRKPLR